MRAEIEKYHLRVLTVNGWIKMWPAYLWCLETLPLPTPDASEKPRHTWIVNGIHKAPVWFILLLSARANGGPALTHMADGLGCGSPSASWVGSYIHMPSRNPRPKAVYIKTMVAHGEHAHYAHGFHHQGNPAPFWLPMSSIQSGAPRPKHAHDKGGVPWQTFNKWTVRYVKSSLSWFLVLTDPGGLISLSSTKQEELVDKTFSLQRCVNPELGIKKLKSVIYIYLYIDIKIDDHTKTKKVKQISMSILYI